MKTIVITLKSAEEVTQELRERLGDLHQNSDVSVSKGETPWVWLQTSKENTDVEGVKETLKDIGFKWSTKRKSWYHTCEMDTTKRAFRPWKKRSGNTKPEDRSQSKPTAKPVAKYSKDYSDVNSEFARRFA